MTQRGRKSRAELAVVGIEPAVLRPSLAPVPSSRSHKPPDHLGEPERRLWKQVFRDFDIETGASVAVLTTALEAHQRARQAREVIDREGMTTTGRDGQAKAHPLLAVGRDARQAFLAGFRAMRLEL
jgi:P27 family predicted phage terminase small subunit